MPVVGHPYAFTKLDADTLYQAKLTSEQMTNVNDVQNKLSKTEATNTYQTKLSDVQLTNIAKINDINTKTTTHEDKLGKLGSLFDMTSNRGKLHLNGTDYYVKEDGT